MKNKYLLLVSLSFLLHLKMVAQTTLELTYVGNMGVLIHDQETAMLIDGLHKEFIPNFGANPACGR